MENSNATALVDVEFDFMPDLYPTLHLRWYKPNMTAILQQFWTDDKGGGEWRDVEIVREI